MSKGNATNHPNRYSEKYVKNFYENYGCKLLDKYVNLLTKIRYICKCGNIVLSTFASFKNSKHRCKECAINTYRISFEKVKKYFNDNNCELLEQKYKNNETKMKYRCCCNRISYISFGSFKNGSRCYKCGKEKNIAPLRTSFEKIKNEIENDKKYELLTSKEKYKSTDTLLAIKCNKCSRIHKKDICKFRIWCGCYHTGKKNRPMGKQCFNWIKDRKKLNEEVKFKKLCNTLLRNTLKSFNINKNDSTYKQIGYDGYELRKYIHSLPNWNNVKNKKWSIDHIFPLKAFVEYNIFDTKLINCFDNLNVLNHKENSKKGCSYNKYEFEKWLIAKGIKVKK